MFFQRSYRPGGDARQRIRIFEELLQGVCIELRVHMPIFKLGDRPQMHLADILSACARQYAFGSLLRL